MATQAKQEPPRNKKTTPAKEWLIGLEFLPPPALPGSGQTVIFTVRCGVQENFSAWFVQAPEKTYFIVK